MKEKTEKRLIRQLNGLSKNDQDTIIRSIRKASQKGLDLEQAKKTEDKEDNLVSEKIKPLPTTFIEKLVACSSVARGSWRSPGEFRGIFDLVYWGNELKICNGIVANAVEFLNLFDFFPGYDYKRLLYNSVPLPILPIINYRNTDNHAKVISEREVLVWEEQIWETLLGEKKWEIKWELIPTRVFRNLVDCKIEFLSEKKSLNDSERTELRILKYEAENR